MNISTPFIERPVMTVLLLRLCPARMPLLGGVMGSKRPFRIKVGTVLVTGVPSTGARSRTFQAWHSARIDLLLASWSRASSGRTLG